MKKDILETIKPEINETNTLTIKQKSQFSTGSEILCYN